MIKNGFLCLNFVYLIGSESLEMYESTIVTSQFKHLLKLRVQNNCFFSIFVVLFFNEFLVVVKNFNYLFFVRRLS